MLFLLFLLGVLTIFQAHGQGRLLPPQKISSAVLGSTRTIRIYLPASYDQQPARRYPVLYLQDGQNVFSSAGTNCCFGWGSWELDKTVDQLSREDKMREIIMVGIDCTADRFNEYSGHILSKGQTNLAFEHYANFLIQELKPKIDREYRTLIRAADTGVLGSSLGGIGSLALGWEHPEIFGQLASLSGAFQVDQTNFLDRVLRPCRSRTVDFRVYVDSGVVDYTGGDDNRTLSFQVVTELRRLGWSAGLEYYLDDPPMTSLQLEKTGLRADKWSEAQTSQHNEFYWRQRSWRALTFLFPPEKPAGNSAKKP